MADAPKTPEELLAEQQQINADLANKIEALTALVGTAKTTEVVEKKAAVIVLPTDTVKSGKKKYKWAVASFKLPGNDVLVLAEEAATSQETIDAIVAIDGQGILTEVV